MSKIISSEEDPLIQMPRGYAEFRKDWHIALGILFYGFIIGIIALIMFGAFARSVFGVL